MTETMLLILGAAVCVGSSAGVLAMSGVYNKLHYLAPANVLGTALVAAAILVKNGLNQGGIKTLIILVLLVISNPVLTQATARAARTRESRVSNEDPEGGP